MNQERKTIPAVTRLQEISDLFRQVSEEYVKQMKQKVETMKKMKEELDGTMGKD